MKIAKTVKHRRSYNGINLRHKQNTFVIQVRVPVYIITWFNDLLRPRITQVEPSTRSLLENLPVPCRRRTDMKMKCINSKHCLLRFLVASREEKSPLYFATFYWHQIKRFFIVLFWSRINGIAIWERFPIFWTLRMAH